MALAPTVLLAGGDDTDRTGSPTAYQTPAVALTAGHLYLLFVTTKRSDANNNGTLSATQTGATWVSASDTGTGNTRSTLFRTQPASDVASAVISVGNFDAAPIDFTSWVLVDITGAFQDPTFYGSFAVPAQTVVAATGTSLSADMSANATFGFFYHSNTPSFTTVTGTELTDTALGSRAIACYWDEGSGGVSATAANSALYNICAVRVLPTTGDDLPAPDITLQPTADTVLNRRAATTNYSSSTELFMGGAHMDTSPLFQRNILLDFDISAVTGLASAAILYLTVSSDGGGANNGERPHVAARRVLRNDTVFTETTWNIYKTGNNWSFGGAAALGLDTEENPECTGDDMQSNAPGTIYRVDIAEILNVAITNADTRFISIVYPSQFTASENVINFASMEHATSAWHPYLDITYLCIPVHPEPLFIPYKDRLQRLAGDFTVSGIVTAVKQQLDNWVTVERWANRWMTEALDRDSCDLFIPFKDHSDFPPEVSAAQSFDNWKAIERWAYRVAAGECGCGCQDVAPPPDRCRLFVPHKDHLLNVDVVDPDQLARAAEREFDNFKTLERWANRYARAECGCDS